VRRTLSFGAAVAALLTLVGVTAPAIAAAPPRAAGGVVYTNLLGQDMHLAFEASGVPGDARGQIVFHDPVTKVSFKADVDCYFQVGDQGQLSGAVVSGDLAPGTRIRVIALDGGTPGRDGDLVRVTRRPVTSPAFQCDRPNTAERPVVAGNLNVGPSPSPSSASLARSAMVPDELPGDQEL
jgi:hypothetical protein